MLISLIFKHFLSAMPPQSCTYKIEICSINSSSFSLLCFLIVPVPLSSFLSLCANQVKTSSCFDSQHFTIFFSPCLMLNIISINANISYVFSAPLFPRPPPVSVRPIMLLWFTTVHNIFFLPCLLLNPLAMECNIFLMLFQRHYSLVLLPSLPRRSWDDPTPVSLWAPLTHKTSFVFLFMS